MILNCNAYDPIISMIDSRMESNLMTFVIGILLRRVEATFELVQSSDWLVLFG